MKTYLLDSFYRFKRFSERLDAKSILSNKTWHVFNDTGEKEVYIFEEDGNLIISVNGVVTEASWKFIPSNQTILIKTENQKLMLLPSFKDDNIFSLQLDGTNKHVFLIDDVNKASTNFKTLADIREYFIQKEKKIIEQEEKEKNIKLQEAEREKEKLTIANNIALLDSIVKEELSQDYKYYKIRKRMKIRDKLYNISLFTFIGWFLFGMAVSAAEIISLSIYFSFLISAIILVYIFSRLLKMSKESKTLYEQNFRKRIANERNLRIS